MHRPLRLNLLSAFMSLLLVASALLLAAPACAHAEGTQKSVDSTMTITMQKSDGGTASGDTNSANKGASTASSSTNAKKTASTGDALPLAAAGMIAILAGAAYCLVQSRKLSLAQGAHAATGSRGSLARQRDLSAAAKRVLSVVLATVLAASLCFGAFASKASAAEDGTEAEADASGLAECTANVVIDEEGNVISADVTLANDSDSIIDILNISAPEELDGWEAAFDYLYWDEEGGSWDADIDSWFWDEADYSDIAAELSSTDAAPASAEATLASDEATLADDSAASDAMAEVKSGAKATGTWSGAKVPSDVVAKVKAAGSARLGFQTLIVMKHAVIFDANAPEGTTATLDGVNSRKTTTVQDGASLPSYRIPDDSAVKCSSKDYVFAGWGTSPTEDPLNGKKKDELAAANTSMTGPQRYYALWLTPGSYWLNVANAANPEKGLLKNCTEIAEDMEVLHGTKAQTSAGKDKAAVTAEYTNYMNGKSADGSTTQEVRLYTKWNGDDAGDGANRWVEFRIIQVGEHDGDGSAVTFMATHSLPTAQIMNSKDDNETCWSGSLMRKTMNDENGYVMKGLSDLSGAVKAVNKMQATYNGDSWNNWASKCDTADKFWLLSFSELFGDVALGFFRNEGSRYAWCVANVTNPTGANTAIAGMDKTRAGSGPAGGYGALWWERSPYVRHWRDFGGVNANGSGFDDYGIPGGYHASYRRGVVPAFSM